MCGICGVFYSDRGRHVKSNVLSVMNRRIVHRGPDDEGYLVEENVGLAMRRLSIIDVKTGHQPLANEAQDVWVVFNGEIYNHAELRAGLEAKGHRYRTRSDTETIVHLYEEYGRDCVQQLRGMFAFVIWDQAKRVLFAARDRLGIKPFYYRWDGKTFLFGSETEAIVYRKKMGFPTPWEYWLAGPPLEEIQRLLLEPRSLARGLFRPEAVGRILAEHRAGHRDHGNRIWRLLNLELWQRVSLDGEPVPTIRAWPSHVATR